MKMKMIDDSNFEWTALNGGIALQMLARTRFLFFDRKNQ